MLVDAYSFSSFLFILASTVWKALPSVNLVVFAITSQIIQAVTATGLSDE